MSGHLEHSLFDKEPKKASKAMQDWIAQANLTL